MQDAQQAAAAAPLLDGSELNIAVVQARFNTDVTQALWQACQAELLRLGVAAENIHHYSVPGALEVPSMLSALAQSTQHQYDALIALGCIIRGETYHFELVANESGAGVRQVALQFDVPIANAILTVENMAQAVARQTDKGRDAAQVAVEMANLVQPHFQGADYIDEAMLQDLLGR